MGRKPRLDDRPHRGVKDRTRGSRISPEEYYRLSLATLVNGFAKLPASQDAPAHGYVAVEVGRCESISIAIMCTANSISRAAQTKVLRPDGLAYRRVMRVAGPSGANGQMEPLFGKTGLGVCWIKRAAHGRRR
jgi:hypothetical protein